MKKFELTNETTILFGKKLFRIRALVDFGDVRKGDMGGYVEKEDNLSPFGNAWVYDNAKVCGGALVYGDAKVCGDALVCGNAWVYGDAKVCGNAWVYGDAKVYGNAWVRGDAKVCGNALVYGDGDYTTIKGFGSEYRNTTFFKEKDKRVHVVCGCFYGDLEQFKEKVKQTHGDTKFAKEYLMIADLMEYHFSEIDTKE